MTHAGRSNAKPGGHPAGNDSRSAQRTYSGLKKVHSRYLTALPGLGLLLKKRITAQV